jgi:hypothetical protein
METKDEETRHFFKHSLVKVILCRRSGRKSKKKVGYRFFEATAIYLYLIILYVVC